MATYVLSSNSRTWHWCRNCPSYPFAGNIAKKQTTRPSWDLCEKCKGLERRRECRT